MIDFLISVVLLTIPCTLAALAATERERRAARDALRAAEIALDVAERNRKVLTESAEALDRIIAEIKRQQDDHT